MQYTLLVKGKIGGKQIPSLQIIRGSLFLEKNLKTLDISEINLELVLWTLFLKIVAMGHVISLF